MYSDLFIKKNACGNVWNKMLVSSADMPKLFLRPQNQDE